MKYMADCRACMAQFDERQRQLVGCGFLPPPEPGIPVDIWSPSSMDPRWDGIPGRAADEDKEPRICPGYTTGLPEVLEVARARFHWEKGALREFAGGEPTALLMQGLELFEVANAAMRNWATKPKKDGGGGA